MAEIWRAWVPEPEGEPLVLAAQLPQLPGLWDLAATPEVIAPWTGIFRGNADYVRHVLAQEGTLQEREAGARVFEIFETLLRDLERGTAASSVRTIHAVTLVRERLLRAHGIPDPYRGVKAREAARWLPETPAALAAGFEAGGATDDLDATALVLGGVLAGNLFDLGSRSTQAAFRAGRLDPLRAVAAFRVQARQWLDQASAAVRERLRPCPVPLNQPPAGRMLLFADNAGADFLLGILPAALFFARRYEVTLVVNREPASSDITLEEARALLEPLGADGDSALARVLAAERLRLIDSGTGSPGIDLRHVGRALNDAAREADWILIEGQGRAVETNWETGFTCPSLRVAVVKEPLVAQRIGVAAGSPCLRYDEPWTAAGA
jgi:uncharacterized protein with ATP-grasp and redox domains